VLPILSARVTDCPFLAEVSELAEPGSGAECIPIVFPLMLLRVKIRDAEKPSGRRTKPFYVALGVHPEGERDGFWAMVANNEGAKFWLLGDEQFAQPGASKTS